MRREAYFGGEPVGFELDVGAAPVKFSYEGEVCVYDAIAAVLGCTIFEAAEAFALACGKPDHGIATNSRRFGPGAESLTVTERGFYALVNRLTGRKNELAVETIGATLSELAQEWSKKAAVREGLKARLGRVA